MADRHETEMHFVNNFRVDECSIPEGMTVEQWRRANAKPRAGLRAKVTRLRRRQNASAQTTNDDHPSAA